MPPLHKTFACVAVGAIAFAASAFAAVENGLFHEQVLVELERKLGEQFVGDFDAERLSGTLLWGFTAHNVEIRNGRGEPVAHIDEFQVDASAYALLDGEFRFDRARLVRPVVLVERYAGSTSKVDQVFKSRSPSGKSRPAGKVLFEMSRAEVIDGQVVYVDSEQPTPWPAPADRRVDVADDSKLSDEAPRATFARALNAAGSFRVLSGRKTKTLIDRLEAEIVAGESAQPRRVKMVQARIETGPNALNFAADNLTVDDHWRLDNVRTIHPRGDAAPDSGPVAPVEFHGRASSPGGGWIQLDGRVDRRDHAYHLAIEAEDFKPADWPGAPQWSWLVLDGAGAISGRGWTRDDIDATVQWTTNDVEVAGERLDELRLRARVADDRVDVERLDATAAGFSARATGHLTKGGAFSLDLETGADDAVVKRLIAAAGTDKSRAHLPGVGLEEVAHLDLSTRATGALDLSAREPAKLLRHLKAEATWKARGVVYEDVRWKVAGGSLNVRLPAARRTSAAHKGRKFRYEASAVVHDLRRGSLGADILRATVRGDGIFEPDAGIDGLSYKLDIEGDRLAFGEHSAKTARLVVSGALTPADDGGEWPLEALAAKGTLDLTHYRHPELSAKRVATNIDVRGPFPLGEGTLVTHMTGLRTKDRRFRHAKTELRLLDGQRFRLKSKARVEISLIPDLPMYLEVSGRLGRDFKAASVSNLTLGRPGMRWKIQKPGLVLFKDDSVVLQSLTLQRRSQRVRLDGAFGDGKTGSLSAICSRLKNAQIRSFFDIGPLF